MIRPGSIQALLAIFFLLLFVPSLEAGKSLHVVVTIKPIHSIIAGLMKGTEGPELLIDDQALPWDFKPSQAQEQQIANADLLFWVGPELETNLQPTLQKLGPKTQVIELLDHQGLKVLPARGASAQRDPFFWLDNRNLLIILDDLTHLLEEADPQRTHVYERNRGELLARLAQLDREYEYGYRGLKSGLGVQYHDTLQYFEQAYALKIIDHVAGLPGSPVDTSALLRVRERLSNSEAICLLTERGFPSPNLDLLIEGSEANQGELDSLGIGMQAGPDLYFEVMEHNTRVIKRCLNADEQSAQLSMPPAGEDALPAVEGFGVGRFLLNDQLGRVVSNETMQGKYVLIYFGYTFCPDVCPTTLQIMFQALNLLGEQAKEIQPYFITIDPARDTTEVMRRYVQYYDDRLIGVTGSPEMIERVAASFKARYEKVKADSGDPSYYLMDHTASLFLLDPQGKFITKFAYGMESQDLANALRDKLPH